MIRKLQSASTGFIRARKIPRTGKRRNLGTFGSRKAAVQHERDIQYFKRH